MNKHAGKKVDIFRLRNQPRDCAADPIGMVDGVRVASYLLDAYVDDWRAWAPLYTASLIIGADAVDSYAFYYVDKNLTDPVYADCARLMAPNALLTPILVGLMLMVVAAFMQAAFVFLLRFFALLAALFGG